MTNDRHSPRLLLSLLVVLSSCLLWVTTAQAQWMPMNPVRQVQQQPDGVLFSMGTGALKVQVCSDSIIRVLYSPTDSFPKRTDFVVIKESWPAAQWTMQSTDDSVTLATSLLRITVTKKDGAITYADVHGGALLQESSRHMTPEKVKIPTAPKL